MLKLLPILFLFLGLHSSQAQTQSFWQRISTEEIRQLRTDETDYLPEAYFAYRLDSKALQAYLQQAPVEFDANSTGLILQIPMADGRLKSFRVYDSPIMEPGLAGRYPQIRTFKGYPVDGSDMNIRFDISPKGFRASLYGPDRMYIDAMASDPTAQIVYFTKDYREDISGFNLSCGLDPIDILEEDLGQHSTPDPIELPGMELNLRQTTECDSVHLYTYRLALSCTGEWASAHGGTVESVLSDMVTSVNRINQIYENEFSIRLLLIEENDKLIWLDKDDDPFPIANVGYELLSVNTVVLNNNVGRNAYDIGHVFTRSCTDVGGVASLGSVCSDNRKGSAVTCHYSNNLNYIIVNVTAHEMGHQFAASHTFNNCSGNESAGSDYEPGGGVTIMAYCGLCGSNDVDYACLETFHAHSIEQVKNFTRVGGGRQCTQIETTGNTAPSVELPYSNGFSIPILTPFKLEGSAFDCEGDAMTYSWEEWDLGPQVPIGEPLEDAPIFTAMEPRSEPYRYFPDLGKVINNFSNNSELLPEYTRPLNFRFIARDNHPGGGGTGWKNVSFRAEGNAGPFRVSHPNQTAQYKIGQELEIRWDVANTDVAPVGCQTVNIWLSSDAGYNYTHLLKFQTPNDGIETVVVPNVESSLVRIKIEAADNIFFDISDRNLKVSPPDVPAYYMEASPLFQQVCLPAETNIAITSAGFNGYSDTIRFEVASGLPEGAIAVFEPEWVLPGASALLKLNLNDVEKRDLYELVIQAISGSGDTLFRTVELDIVTNDYSDLQILQPLPGASGQTQLPEFIWTDAQSANSYNVFLSTSPAFPTDETQSALAVSDTRFTPKSTLKKSTLYYWKIEGINECGNRDATPILTFATEAFSCKTFSSGDLPQDIRSNQTTRSVISIGEETTVADVNVVSISGDHDNFYDLDGSLTGPDGTTVSLFSAKCFQNGALVFDFGLDDESTQKFKCPPYQGMYYPSGSLSEFIGLSAKGDWTLDIFDRQSPKGGELEGFQLEICANTVLSNPYLVNNESFLVAIGLEWGLPSSRLQADDEDNLPSEIVYTLVERPLFTDVWLDGKNLGVGDQFTEEDLRNGSVSLFANGPNGAEDGFVFTLTDGNGGWLDKTRFAFILDEQVSTLQADLEGKVKLFPNPAGEKVFVLVQQDGQYQWQLFDLLGKQIHNGMVQGFSKKEIDLSSLVPGVYYVRIKGKHTETVQKMIRQ